MKKFIIEKDYLELLPDTHIGILVCSGIDNRIKDPDKYRKFLDEAQIKALQYIPEDEFISNPIIKEWREAFYKFRTKKGARCSLESLLKRVRNGGTIGCINPLVDIYNGISMTHGIPVGGEDIDRFVGDNRLTLADGTEEFVTYGSDKSEPPYPGEVIYKDEAGAICRCYTWRESVRTMLREETVNAFICSEIVNPERLDAMNEALDHMAEIVRQELGGTVEKCILNKDNREAVIAA